MRYYSEFGEDKWLHENRHLIVGGKVYVDVGCADPITGSNTAFLRDQGWSGLAIDGNPVYRDRWKTPFENAIVSTEPLVPFNFHDNHYISRVEDGNPHVPAVTLESLLKKHGVGKIDLLTLDVEGHEFEALTSMNIAAHQPRIIIAEYNTQGIGFDWRVRDYLMDRQYYVAFQTLANLIYFHHP